MKIVLAEERNGQLAAERTFSSEIVLLGRDPAVCHFCFEQSRWPMVSRKHAEFHLREGRCLLADANSRFGTFINGQKITTPVEVRVGARVQLGGSGPVVRVVSLEQTPAEHVEPRPSELGRMETFRDASGGLVKPAAPPASAPPPPAPPSPLINQRVPDIRASAPAPPRPAQPPPAGSVAAIQFVGSGPGQGKRIPLNKDVIRLGRDPEGEVVIDAEAAVVSRRHAEIHKRGARSEEHTSELQSLAYLVCRLI